VLRSLCLLAFGCLAGLLLYTYDLKFKTRALEARAQNLAAELQDEGDFLALMRAEVNYLSRPEQIEDLARKHLKLEPIAPAQVVAWKAVISGEDPAWRPQAGLPARKDGIGALIEKAAPAAAPASR
jgi:cell division protein FtsL